MRAWLHAEVAEFVEAAAGLLRADPFTTNVVAVFAKGAEGGRRDSRPRPHVGRGGGRDVGDLVQRVQLISPRSQKRPAQLLPIVEACFAEPSGPTRHGCR
jgi:hypothetical protein